MLPSLTARPPNQHVKMARCAEDSGYPIVVTGTSRRAKRYEWYVRFQCSEEACIYRCRFPYIHRTEKKKKKNHEHLPPNLVSVQNRSGIIRPASQYPSAKGVKERQEGLPQTGVYIQFQFDITIYPTHADAMISETTTPQSVSYADDKYLSTFSFSSTGSMPNTCATPLRPPSLLLLMRAAMSYATVSVLSASIFSCTLFLFSSYH